MDRLHGIYEVHLPVADVERATAFYVDRLGFERAATPGFLFLTDDDRRWMLGLYEAPPRERRHQRERHVSFRVDEADADEMVDWLHDRDIEPVHPPSAPAAGPMKEPIVFGWMPAAAVFFEDLDGNLLELVAELSVEPRRDIGYVPLSEWRHRVE
jgi:catechol 2,3-dioxygenase-like lactoylglutathione lyase family enzyme